MKLSIENLSKYIHPIHKEGYVFIGLCFFLALILNAVAQILGFFGFIITIWCAFFFRNPSRYVPQGRGYITSPADGVVTEIIKSKPPVELDIPLDRDFTKISIDINLFDCHITRSPISSVIDRLEKQEGKQSHTHILFKTEDDYIVPTTLTVGGFASKISSFVKEGKNVKTGERIALMRFCSVVEIYLPEGIAPKIAIGQKMVAGETIIADLKDNGDLIEAVEV